MSSYVGDVFSGRNTDNWLMTGAKLISMPMQFVSDIPIYDSLDRMDEDIEKAKSVVQYSIQKKEWHNCFTKAAMEWEQSRG